MNETQALALTAQHAYLEALGYAELAEISHILGYQKGVECFLNRLQERLELCDRLDSELFLRSILNQ